VLQAIEQCTGEVALNVVRDSFEAHGRLNIRCISYGKGPLQTTGTAPDSFNSVCLPGNIRLKPLLLKTMWGDMLLKSQARLVRI